MILTRLSLQDLMAEELDRMTRLKNVQEKGKQDENNLTYDNRYQGEETENESDPRRDCGPQTGSQCTEEHREIVVNSQLTNQNKHTAKHSMDQNEALPGDQRHNSSASRNVDSTADGLTNSVSEKLNTFNNQSDLFNSSSLSDLQNTSNENDDDNQLVDAKQGRNLHNSVSSNTSDEEKADQPTVHTQLKASQHQTQVTSSDFTESENTTRTAKLICVRNKSGPKVKPKTAKRVKSNSCDKKRKETVKSISHKLRRFALDYSKKTSSNASTCHSGLSSGQAWVSDKQCASDVEYCNDNNRSLKPLTAGGAEFTKKSSNLQVPASCMNQTVETVTTHLCEKEVLVSPLSVPDCQELANSLASHGRKELLLPGVGGTPTNHSCFLHSQPTDMALSPVSSENQPPSEQCSSKASLTNPSKTSSSKFSSPAWLTKIKSQKSSSIFTTADDDLNEFDLDLDFTNPAKKLKV